MFPSLVRLSKASRRPLTGKRANKDYYKGTRQAALPGGHRTGAPGRHVVRGKAKYRLLDERVRVFVAPPIQEINNTPLRPYVARDVRLTSEELAASAIGKFPGPGGLTPELFLKVMREHSPVLTAENTAVSEGGDKASTSKVVPNVTGILSVDEMLAKMRAQQKR